MSNAPATPEFKYYAFISYRHADNKEVGREWATWLHRAIETYEVPQELVGQHNDRGEKIPERIFPIFRDEEELPADADLSGAIVGALDVSRLLVVLCSPRATESTYVEREIDHFKAIGRSDRIIAAIIDGEPNASWDIGKQAAGFAPTDECFPVALQFEYDETGQRTETRAEPVASDFRIVRDGKPEQGWASDEAYADYLKSLNSYSRSELQEHTDNYQRQKQLMLLKVIAGVLAVPLGDFTQRDQEYQLQQERLRAKRLRRWLGAVAGLAVLLVVIGIFALNSRTLALQSQADLLINSSVSLAREGNATEAALNLQQALGLEPESRTARARLISLLTQRTFPSRVRDLKPFPDEAWQSVRDPSGRWLALLSETGKSLIIDSEDFTSWSLPTQSVTSIKFAEKANLMLVSDGQYLLELYDLSSRASTVSVPDRTSGTIAISADGRYIAADNIWDISATPIKRIGRVANPSGNLNAHFTARNELVSLSADGLLRIQALRNESSLAPTRTARTQPPSKFAVDAERGVVAISGAGGRIQIWSTTSLDLVAEFEGSSQVSGMMFQGDALIYSTISGAMGRWQAGDNAGAIEKGVHKSAIAYIDGLNGVTVSASWDGTVVLSSDQARDFEPVRLNETVTAVMATSDPNKFITNTTDGRMEVWRYGLPDFGHLNIQSAGNLTHVAYSDDLSVIAIVEDAAHLRLFNASGALLGETRLSQAPVRLDVSGDGDQIGWVTTAGTIVNAAIDANGMLPLRRSQLDPIPVRILGGDEWNRLLVERPDGSLRLINGDSGAPVSLRMIPQSKTHGAVQMVNENLVISFNEDGSTTVWEMSTGRPVVLNITDALPARPNLISARDGSLYLVKNRQLWHYELSRASAQRADSEQQPGLALNLKARVSASEDIISFAHSDDGELLATGSLDGAVNLWNLAESERPVLSLKMGVAPQSLDIDPSGQWLLAGLQDGKMQTLDILSGLRVARDVDHAGAVLIAKFDGQGNKTLSVATSGEVQINETGLHLVASMPASLVDVSAQLVEGVPASSIETAFASRMDWAHWLEKLTATVDSGNE